MLSSHTAKLVGLKQTLVALKARIGLSYQVDVSEDEMTGSTCHVHLPAKIVRN